jgi:hypothetical protein
MTPQSAPRTDEGIDMLLGFIQKTNLFVLDRMLDMAAHPTPYILSAVRAQGLSRRILSAAREVSRLL